MSEVIGHRCNGSGLLVGGQIGRRFLDVAVDVRRLGKHACRNQWGYDSNYGQEPQIATH